MPDALTLAPLDDANRPPTAPAPGGYATFTRAVAVRLAQAMPDAQSAVLHLLAWTAVLNTKMKRGPLAGRPLASLSGGQLARATGRPLRTVRYALRQLVARGLVLRHPTPAGRKGVYEVPILAAPPVPDRGGEHDEQQLDHPEGAAGDSRPMA